MEHNRVSGQPQDDEHTTVNTRAYVPLREIAQPDDIGHYLVALKGGEPGRRVLLGPAPLSVGRDSTRDLVLLDPDVSRLHLSISLDGDRVIVEDQQSMNGTRIDGERIVGPTVLAEGSLLQLGHHVLRLERRSKREVQQSEAIARDLDRASHYVRALLPPPLCDGPIRAEWLFQPSALLGGDALGYGYIDADHFAIYMIDVSGHGTGAAMHSVSVLNMLRQRALPANACDPAGVLTTLNARFQMEEHDGMYFTMWYGVYDVPHRTLRYACAGHHPGYLAPPAKDTVVPLRTPGLMIGATPKARYCVGQTPVPAGSSLYLFSDGVFDVVTKEQQQWRLHDFVPLLLESSPDRTPEAERLYRAVRSIARPGPLEDDFSMMVVTFS
jgi:serine phosphatase RsbU (regulator of sigma subunit)